MDIRDQPTWAARPPGWHDHPAPSGRGHQGLAPALWLLCWNRSLKWGGAWGGEAQGGCLWISAFSFYKTYAKPRPCWQPPSLWTYVCGQLLRSFVIWAFSTWCHGLPWWLSGKESAWQRKGCGFNPWFGKIPWRRKLSNILIWDIPWTEEPGGLQSRGPQRIGHGLNNLACMQRGWFFS